jgi:hypothetical protein
MEGLPPLKERIELAYRAWHSCLELALDAVKRGDYMTAARWTRSAAWWREQFEKLGQQAPAPPESSGAA